MVYRIPALASAYAKMERADKHIADFASWVRESAFNESAYDVTTERLPDGSHVRKARHNSAEIPRPVTAVVGDAVHNLRSSLDHVAWAIALRHRAPVYLGSVYFEIRENRDKFESTDTQRKLAILGPDGIHFMNGLKPYGEPHGIALFWTLHRLDIRDKHRALLTTGIYTTSLVETGAPGERRTSRFSPNRADWHPFTQDVPIARWRDGDPEPHVQLISNVAFDEPEVPDRQPVLAVLSNMRGLVEWVLETAEREIAWS